MLLILKVEHHWASEGVTQVQLRGVDEPGTTVTLRITDRQEAKQFEPGTQFTFDIEPILP
jgi:hypothetical protein